MSRPIYDMLVALLRRSMLGAAVAMLCVSPAVLAGDDVDYSAPYLTLENGELVTKYPAKDHTVGAVTDAASAEPAVESQQLTESARMTLAFSGGVIAVIVLGLLFVRGRRQRSNLG